MYDRLQLRCKLIAKPVRGRSAYDIKNSSYVDVLQFCEYVSCQHAQLVPVFVEEFQWDPSGRDNVVL